MSPVHSSTKIEPSFMDLSFPDDDDDDEYRPGVEDELDVRMIFSCLFCCHVKDVLLVLLKVIF